jgi:hypothetical protein
MSDAPWPEFEAIQRSRCYAAIVCDRTDGRRRRRGDPLAKAAGPRPRPHPVRHVAERVGTHIDSERAIRCLIALIVLCSDPLAITLTCRGVGTAINYRLKHWSVDVMSVL